ncbi:hypothetical protein FXO38_03200 [Capsicum annuum]|uniref:Retrovirus-related Pol polyprotein from transposon TNT 1-94-like beta-barrel domain-containing protein n=1 Tax=Capsicum annuum TaxID=4072 RepID=A0A2G2YQ09_CAPAN|nr:hypothetical protein FXO38_03200 [Capsicum annuum]PHT71828.1 hypothetical protein T459_22613 [Capsicum annuum]
MDSGITYHLTSDLDNLGIHYEYESPEEVTLGNYLTLWISHIGASSIVASDKNFKLDDILHFPTATQNLISISSFTTSYNVFVEFFTNHFLIRDLATRVPLHRGRTNRGLYLLPVTRLFSPASIVASLGVWHAHLAHAYYPTIHQALPSTIFQSSKSPRLCTTCVVSKSHKISFSESSFQTSSPLDLICSDVWGPSPVVPNDDYHYYVIVNILGFIFLSLNLNFCPFLFSLAL